MSQAKHFQFIMDALEVGLESIQNFESIQNLEINKPRIFNDLPPVSIRAIVILDGEAYEVYVKAAEPGEAHEPKVNHED